MQYIESRAVDPDVARLDSRKFDTDAYLEAGVFVLREIIPVDLVQEWQQTWKSFYAEHLAAGREVDPFNPVVVHEVPPSSLAAIHRCTALLDVMVQVYPDLALYMQRLLVKDARSRAPVFLHHDFCYDRGWPEKTSVFVPLDTMDAANGGLTCYPRTHRFGYLGDVGEFDPAVIGASWPKISPHLAPGDILLMHECTWHESAAHTSGPDRVLVQITYQPASDPTGAALLRGEWRTALRIADIAPSAFFRRSRASRLRDLQQEVARLTPAVPKE